MIIGFYFHRKNPLSFLGVAIGKFVEFNVKSSIDNYFNKGTVSKEEESVCNQSIHKPESRASCSTISDTVESDSSKSCDKKLQSNPKSSAVILNQLPSLSNNINCKKTDNCLNNNVKSIKTMFAEMKSTNKSYDDSTATIQNVDIKNESKKSSINSFFSNKLKIMSPVKNQVNDKVSDLSSRASPVSFFSKKLEIISPSKNILNDNVLPATRAQDGFFSRKLEIVSPSKPETSNDSPLLAVIQPPIMEETDGDVPSKLLCERCEKMIDIDLYDEHYDHHIAVELSKSWNSDGIVKPLVKSELHQNGLSKKKKNESGQKRKHNSNTSNSDSKKQCSSISSYFKPVLNP